MADKDAELVENIRNLLWGPTVKADVFKQWAQGFYFSPDEPTALVQTDGGPCAVIAPVQAFIIKQLLSQKDSDISEWKNIKAEKCDELLVKAVTEILAQAAGVQNPNYSIIYLSESSDMVNGEVPAAATTEESLTGSEERITEAAPSTSEGPKESLSENFHSRLRIKSINNIEEVEKYFMGHLSLLKETFGILILLYSVVCTKGIDGMQAEVSNTSESPEYLIESIYGYGSQNLINLMLTGRAVGHVWDHEQDVGGLRLLGIDKQNSVGFLAYLEHLQYCQVGAFLKSPSHPVWVLGSETHLTVLFSTDKNIVTPETKPEMAKRIFNKYNKEGNNFIPTTVLPDILAELSFCQIPEYVDIMKQKLDKESLGIILLSAFMDEFFPGYQDRGPDTFILYHYNGLPRSNPGKKVVYHRGQAALLESNVNCVSNHNMLTCLQTKWQNIDVVWDNNVQPSLN